jgi:hypothetical protein
VHEGGVLCVGGRGMGREEVVAVTWQAELTEDSNVAAVCQSDAGLERSRTTTTPRELRKERGGGAAGDECNHMLALHVGGMNARGTRAPTHRSEAWLMGVSRRLAKLAPPPSSQMCTMSLCWKVGAGAGVRERQQLAHYSHLVALLARLSSRASLSASQTYPVVPLGVAAESVLKRNRGFWSVLPVLSKLGGRVLSPVRGDLRAKKSATQERTVRENASKSSTCLHHYYRKQPCGVPLRMDVVGMK